MNVLVIPGTNRCAAEIISSLSSMKDVTLFGGGSDLDYNKDTYVPFLKKFIVDNNIKNIVDLGCGDGAIDMFIEKEFITLITFFYGNIAQEYFLLLIL